MYFDDYGTIRHGFYIIFVTDKRFIESNCLGEGHKELNPSSNPVYGMLCFFEMTFL